MCYHEIRFENLQCLKMRLQLGLRCETQLQGGEPPPGPWPGALPLDSVGGSAPDPRYRLALCALAIEPPFHKSWHFVPQTSYGPSPPDPTGGLPFPRLFWVGIPSLVCITNTILSSVECGTAVQGHPIKGCWFRLNVKRLRDFLLYTSLFTKVGI